MNIIDNKEKQHFEFHVDEHVAYIEYMKTDDMVYLQHTEVPEALQGKGVALKMIKGVLAHISEDPTHKLVPMCPFVMKFLVRNKEYNHLLADGFKFQ